MNTLPDFKLLDKEFGPHVGLNTEWNSRAWRVSDHVFILDEEEPAGALCVVMYLHARVIFIARFVVGHSCDCGNTEELQQRALTRAREIAEPLTAQLTDELNAARMNARLQGTGITGDVVVRNVLPSFLPVNASLADLMSAKTKATYSPRTGDVIDVDGTTVSAATLLDARWDTDERGDDGSASTYVTLKTDKEPRFWFYGPGLAL
jgi:hypothetical protein